MTTTHSLCEVCDAPIGRGLARCSRHPLTAAEIERNQRERSAARADYDSRASERIAAARAAESQSPVRR